MRLSRYSIAGLILLTGVTFSWYIIASAESNSTDSSGVNVWLNVPGCNFDAICDAGSGETVANCPSDCTPTTPPPPPPPGGGTTGGGTGYVLPFTIDNLKVITDKNKAVITWTTRYPTQSVVTWGLGLEYEAGSLAEGQYTYEHRVVITGLTPATIYFFHIAAKSAAGYRVDYSSSFLTRSIPDTVPPGNVMFLKAYPYRNGIGLEWKNPSDPDFDSVRLVRNQFHYPRDPRDGKVIYESDGEFFLDRDIVTNLYYNYAVFARDVSGNYSSGALARAIVYRMPPGNPIDTTGGAQFPNDQGNFQTATSTIKLSLYDYDFIQKGKPILFVGDHININPSEKLTVLGQSLPAEVEYVHIELDQPSGAYAYGFTKNKAGEWITVIPENMITTLTPFTITAETHKDRSLVTGVFVPRSGSNQNLSVWCITFLWYLIISLFLLLLLLMLVIIILLIRRRKKEKELV